IKNIGYENAGTIEYLVDEKGENFYFMEMNTRIQVEHPVTEEVYGVDLVRKQIEIAAGIPLGKEFDDLKPLRHAIEIRINAEDPYDGFRPSPGKIEFMFPPGGIGVRLDTHAYTGYTIPPNYDSMIGKLIVSGPDRKIAIDRALRALSEFSIRGIKTTIPIASEILLHRDFQKGDYSTHFIESHFGGVSNGQKKG
ncbi:MAG TPA: acetyl-CoA carboxylase biotin carboxylase subunit, partial [Candidatus Methylacidiphilales bacterium]